MSGRYLKRIHRQRRRLGTLKGVSVKKYALFGALLLTGGTGAFAQSVDKESEEVAVVELGGAAERSITEGNSSFGPTVAVEVTPIEKWLELEASVTPLFRRHSTEWSEAISVWDSEPRHVVAVVKFTGTQASQTGMRIIASTAGEKQFLVFNTFGADILLFDLTALTPG